MIVYLFDENTREFLGEYTPQKNPKRQGEYILPRYSTTLKPQVRKGFVSVFNNNKWEYIPDFRGEEIIDLQTGKVVICSELGDLPEGFMLYAKYILTDEYRQKCEEDLKTQARNDLLMQIEELDKKRIRAICEPEQKTEDMSWLEYYTNQIIDLREKLKEV